MTYPVLGCDAAHGAVRVAVQSRTRVRRSIRSEDRTIGRGPCGRRRRPADAGSPLCSTTDLLTGAPGRCPDPDTVPLAGTGAHHSTWVSRDPGPEEPDSRRPRSPTTGDPTAAGRPDDPGMTSSRQTDATTAPPGTVAPVPSAEDR